MLTRINPLFLLIVFFLFWGSSFAETPPEVTYPKYVELRFLSPLNSSSSKPNDYFKAAIEKKYCISSTQCLPKATLLEGNLIKVRAASRFDVPGTIELQLKTATLPNGRIIDLNTDLESDNIVHIVDPHARKLPVLFISKNSDVLVDYDTKTSSKVLDESLQVGKTVISAASFGLGAAFSVATELFHPETPNNSIPGRVVVGLANSTGIPDVVYFFKKEPEAKVDANMRVGMHLHKPVLERLFAHVNDQNDSLLSYTNKPQTPSVEIDLYGNIEEVASPLLSDISQD